MVHGIKTMQKDFVMKCYQFNSYNLHFKKELSEHFKSTITMTTHAIGCDNGQVILNHRFPLKTPLTTPPAGTRYAPNRPSVLQVLKDLKVNNDGITQFRGTNFLMHTDNKGVVVIKDAANECWSSQKAKQDALTIKTMLEENMESFDKLKLFKDGNEPLRLVDGLLFKA